jgi:dTDP-D-glucose 4,6-dehydratase
MEKKNILITGVAGLIRSKFAEYIIENYCDEYNVIGLFSHILKWKKVWNIKQLKTIYNK